MSEPITLPAPVIELTTPPRTKWEREYQAFRRLLPHCWPRTGAGTWPSMRDRSWTAATISSPWPCTSWPTSATWPFMSAWSPRSRSRFTARAFAVKYGRTETPRDPLQLSAPAPAAGPVRLRHAPKPRQRPNSDVPAQLDSAGTERYCRTPWCRPWPFRRSAHPRWRGGRHHPNDALLSCAGSGPQSSSPDRRGWLPYRRRILVLLGRDILNAHDLLLNGPRLFLDIV